MVLTFDSVDEILSMTIQLKATEQYFLEQPLPQGLLLVQNGGRRNPWPRLLKYSTNRGVFCHVTHNEMAFSEAVSSVWRPCLFSAIGNRYSNKMKTFDRVCVTKFWRTFWATLAAFSDRHFERGESPEDGVAFLRCCLLCYTRWF